ncbi:WD40-repeat-containing domain protein [Sporodiniella umbellata]|nr:WD40-repeat-containing domain protein [Sporodiniella umbellata]
MAYTRTHSFAPLPDPQRGRSVKLDADPKGKTFLYVNGRSVFIRDLENPTIATEYTEHSSHVTVARYSPSGFYIASADELGNVRIWDTVNKEHVLKAEVRALSGHIHDLCWDGESKRIIVVGDSRGFFAHAFSLDTLASVGSVDGHSKEANSVAIRPQRPFRAVTCSDDMTIAFFHGTPYKYEKSIRNHSRFVTAVQYSPDGELFASAGADGKIFLYDGKTGDTVDELIDDDLAHDGTVYAISWSDDSTQLLSSSADSTAKIWDIKTKTVLKTFTFGSDDDTISNQQIGNLWRGNYLLTVSLNGHIHYLNKDTGKVDRTLHGHSKALSSLAVSDDNTLLTGSYDGRVCRWELKKGEKDIVPRVIEGEGHNGQVSAILCRGDEFISVGIDDTIRGGSISECQFSGKVARTTPYPHCASISKEGTFVVGTSKNVEVFDKNLERIGKLIEYDYDPSTVGISVDGQTIFSATKTNKTVEIRKIGDDKIMDIKGRLEKGFSNACAIAVHPTLNLVAVGDSVGKIYVYDPDTEELVIQRWVFHTSRITSLDWSECGDYLVSSSIDTHIYVWKRTAPTKKVAIKNAHIYAVNGVRFLKNTEKLTVASVGQDAAIRIWEVAKF